MKAARKTGRLAAPMAEWMTRSVREAVDTTALGTALTKASFTAPAVAFRAARDAVKVERAEGIVTVVRDVGRVQSAAGTRAALEGLKVAEGPEDVARLARLAETKGGKTRAILKLAGRGAFALTAAAFDLSSWVFAAVWALFGFTAAVKRITERTTERYLRWRKARRAPRVVGGREPRHLSNEKPGPQAPGFSRDQPSSRARFDALERADPLGPLGRQVRVGAGLQAHGDAAEILVGVEFPGAGLHLDR